VTAPAKSSQPNGAHLAFPFRVGADGRTVNEDTVDDHVRDELIQLLLTNLAERPFLPNFGGGMRRLVFEGASDSTAAVTKATLTQALAQWLSQRLTVQSLDVTVADGTITVDLQYRIAGSPDVRQLTFQRNGG
jgi:phage baseplate assembly protein W